ncbi:MAG: hypothetical protein M3046_06645 [Actinomycetota bacterium]|nr:hypothetical protein [Actinomycetota bacterium]
MSREIVSADWFRERLLAGNWFRVERSWAPQLVTSTSPVIDELVELANSLITNRSILDGLQDEGTLDRSKSAGEVSLTPAVADSEPAAGAESKTEPF